MAESIPQDLWEILIEAVADAWSPVRFRDLGVVVGVSGGADSVALFRALQQLRSRESHPTGFLVAAHFNHQTRGAESDGDQAFVAELVSQMQQASMPNDDLRFVSAAPDYAASDYAALDYATSGSFQSGSAASRTEASRAGARDDEQSLRESRMRFLIETAKQQGARYIALAHNFDDNVETVLHHLVRGTGPAGLAGIGHPRSLDDDLVLVRPLLRVRREHIRAALGQLRQPWREDSSNLSVRYRRNWIRHELIPLIETQFPQASQAIGRAIEGQRSWRSWIDRGAEQWLEKWRVGTDSSIFECSPDHEPAIVVAALQKHWDQRGWSRGSMNYQHFDRLASLICQRDWNDEQDPEAFTLPGNIKVRMTDGRVQLG